MGKRIVFALLALVLLSPHVFAASETQAQSGKTMMEWVAFWYADGWPDCIAFAKRSIVQSVSSEAWPASDFDPREGDVIAEVEAWTIGLSVDTPAIRESLSSLPSNECNFTFVPAEYSFNELTETYAEVVAFAKRRLAVKQVDIHDGQIWVLSSGLGFVSMEKTLTARFGGKVRVVSTDGVSLLATDAFGNLAPSPYPNAHPDAVFEWVLPILAAVLLVCLLAALVFWILARKKSGGKRFLAVWIALLAGPVLAAAVYGGALWRGAPWRHSKQFSETPLLQTNSRVLRLGRYQTAKQDEGDPARLDELAQTSRFYLNQSDRLYYFRREYDVLAAEAKANGKEMDAQLEKLAVENADAALKRNITAQTVAAAENIQITPEEAAAFAAALPENTSVEEARELALVFKISRILKP